MFPFRIGTTSFIYPDSYVQNVKLLAPFLDEIELIFFESNPNSLPSKKDVKELFSLANEYNLFYNIHLPLDISLSTQDISIRHFATDTILQIIDLTAILSPSTFTLHLECEEADRMPEPTKRWHDRIYESIHKLISSGIDGKEISVETLNYPLEWVEEILFDLNLSVCMDLGHLILYGFDMKYVFDRYKNRTSIIHLHGANQCRDHQALDFLSKSNLKTVLEILKLFRGIVSVEVFSFDHLTASLKYLESIWKEREV